MEREVISWNQLGLLILELVKKIRSSSMKPDVVVGIARGGLPISMVIADRLRVPLDFINIKSYKAPGVKETLRVYDVMFENVSGKTVLIVDDIADTGETLLFASNYMIRNKGAKEAYLACLFMKPWSKVRPNFYVKETRSWIVFPWELGELSLESYEGEIVK